MVKTLEVMSSEEMYVLGSLRGKEESTKNWVVGMWQVLNLVEPEPG